MAETKQIHSLRKRVLACLMSVVLVAGIIAPGTLTAFAETPAKTGTTEPVATENANAPDTKADPSPANTAVADNNEAGDEDEALENDEPDNQAAKDAAAAAAGAAGAKTSMSAQDDPIAYAVYENGTLTFKYEAEMPEGAWDVSNTGKTQPWSSKAADITKVVFDASFKNATPLSTYAWFKGCEKLETITDLKNLNTTKTTNMAEMFSGCKALKELDLSAANTKNVGDMKDAFKDCSKLEKVTLGENFSFKTVKLGEDGKPVVGAKELALMKPTAFIINTARGGLIDSRALIEGIKSGKVGGAGLDCIEDEFDLYYYDLREKPLANENLAILRNFPNVIVSPHMAFYTDKTVYDQVYSCVYASVQDDKGGENPYLAG